jgi:DNA-binding PadR family transcriptional regulator
MLCSLPHSNVDPEGGPVSRRTDLLEFAVLGLLHESPMHGYALRKRLNTALGAFRALSYGSLYPCLRELVEKGLIQESSLDDDALGVTRRARIAYELTAEGKEHFQGLVSRCEPSSWEDEEFDVHLAFFARTESAVRLRILEGRRSRLQERLSAVRAASQRNRERTDAYTAALHQRGLDSVEREVRWLDELITAEREGTLGT